MGILIEILKYVEFTIVIAIVGILQREAETCHFERWFDNSWMGRIKNKKLREWLDDDVKWKPLGKYTPPFLYGGYHCFKNAWVFFLISWHVYYTANWWFLLIDGLVWWYVQVMFEGDDSKRGGKNG